MGNCTETHVSPAPHAQFSTTDWSVVLEAGRGDSPGAAVALEQLCRSYWRPLYAYARRRGYSPDDATDLTQELFARLLHSNGIAAARQEKGRFRSFLLGALKHLLADEKARAKAKKRGGGQAFCSWEQSGAEERLSCELADLQSPDLLYDRHWALTVLDHAVSRLRVEFSAAGDESLFDALKDYLTGDLVAPSYAATANRLGLSESAVRSAILRLRRRYGDLVREQVAQTVVGSKEVEEEIRYLRSAVSSSRGGFGGRCPLLQGDN